MLACLDRVIGSFLMALLRSCLIKHQKCIPNISLRASAKVILNSFLKKIFMQPKRSQQLKAIKKISVLKSSRIVGVLFILLIELISDLPWVKYLCQYLSEIYMCVYIYIYIYIYIYMFC